MGERRRTRTVTVSALGVELTEKVGPGSGPMGPWLDTLQHGLLEEQPPSTYGGSVGGELAALRKRAEKAEARVRELERRLHEVLQVAEARMREQAGTATGGQDG